MKKLNELLPQIYEISYENHNYYFFDKQLFINYCKKNNFHKNFLNIIENNSTKIINDNFDFENLKLNMDGKQELVYFNDKIMFLEDYLFFIKNFKDNIIKFIDSNQKNNLSETQKLIKFICNNTINRNLKNDLFKIVSNIYFEKDFFEKISFKEKYIKQYILEIKDNYLFEEYILSFINNKIKIDININNETLKNEKVEQFLKYFLLKDLDKEKINIINKILDNEISVKNKMNFFYKVEKIKNITINFKVIKTKEGLYLGSAEIDLRKFLETQKVKNYFNIISVNIKNLKTLNITLPIEVNEEKILNFINDLKNLKNPQLFLDYFNTYVEKNMIEEKLIENYSNNNELRNIKNKNKYKL